MESFSIDVIKMVHGFDGVMPHDPLLQLGSFDKNIY